MFDSHAHLADPAFAADRDEVVARARAAGCSGITCIATTTADAHDAAAIAAAHPGFVWFTCGVHPHEAASFDDARTADEIRAAVAAGAVAIGECGLDYHYDHSPRDVQRRTLSKQIDLARECARPLVVHTREADADMRGAVRDAAAAGVKGILHCFTGPAVLAEEALAAGWYVSFAGVITFKKWADDELVRMVPDHRILVETDAPYLAPVPYRGKRNEPAYAAKTLEHVARARSASVEAMSALVAANARAIFGLDREKVSA